MNRAGVLLFVALLATPLLAGAEELRSKNAGDARGHFQRGLALADAGRFEEAIIEFQDAYAANPKPAVLFNLAVAATSARRPAQALAYLERYLASAGSGITPQRRRDAEQRLARLASTVARLEVVSEPPDAQLLVDGKPTTSPAIVDPGVHVLTVTASGYEPSTQTIRCAEGKQQSLRVALVRSRVAASTVAAPPPSLLSLRCPVPDTRISVDGVEHAATGTTTALGVSSGSHRIVFERAGYLRQELAVETSAAAVTSIDCKLRSQPTLPPEVSSTLRVTPLTSDARVLLDESPFSGSGSVPSGRHTLRVERPGYRPWSTVVSLPPQRRTDVSVTFVPTAHTARSLERGQTRRLWLSGATTGGGLLLAGVTTWLVVDNASRFKAWRNEQDELDEQWRAATPETAPTAAQRSNDGRADRIKLQDEIAVGTGVAAGALLIAGGILFFSGREQPRVGASIGHRQGAASLSLSF